MKRSLEGAKLQPVTIDSKSGMCTRTPSKIKLNTIEDVRREMARVYREARSGLMDASEAARYIYILVAIGKLIETADVEKRLEQMERRFLK